LDVLDWFLGLVFELLEARLFLELLRANARGIGFSVDLLEETDSLNDFLPIESLSFLLLLDFSTEYLGLSMLSVCELIFLSVSSLSVSSRGLLLS
jgi:hypothetical protein